MAGKTEKLLIPWICAVCLNSSLGTEVQGAISDACSGDDIYNETINVLDCPQGYKVNVTGVRYYAWLVEGECPVTLTTNTNTTEVKIRECCKRNESQCSWVRQEPNDVDDLQRDCSGKHQCKLHFNQAVLSDDPCGIGLSAVRSIRYSCTVNDGKGSTSKTYTSKVLTTTTSKVAGNTTEATPVPSTRYNGKGSSSKTSHKTVPIRTEPTSMTDDTSETATRHNDNSAIAGGAVGGMVVLITIISVGLFCYRRSVQSSSAKPVLTTEQETVNVTGHGNTQQITDYCNVPSEHNVISDVSNHTDNPGPITKMGRLSNSDYYNTPTGSDQAISDVKLHSPEGNKRVTDSITKSAAEEHVSYYNTPEMTDGPYVNVSDKLQWTVYERLQSSENRENMYDSLTK